MFKITNPEYHLPVIRPVEVIAELSSGANCPLHIRGFDINSQKKDEYVVKLRASERMTDPAAAMRELLAAFVGAEMEIPVAEPVIVDVQPETEELTEDASIRQRLRNSIGYNFGTKYLGLGYQVLALTGALPPNLEQQAQDLVVFDLLLQNPDRTKEKPNMLTDGTHLVAFDHELAFSFDSILFAPKNLWEQSGNNRSWLDNLLLLSKVKGRKYDFNGIEIRLERLNEDFWQRAAILVPQDWKRPSFYSIKDTMQDFIAHRQSFLQELKQILA